MISHERRKVDSAFNTQTTRCAFGRFENAKAIGPKKDSFRWRRKNGSFQKQQRLGHLKSQKGGFRNRADPALFYF